MRCTPLLTFAAFCLAALVGAVSREAHAQYYPRLFTGTRMEGMGGAGVSLVDDEQAIFVNPAGLANVKGFTFNYTAADVEMSTDTILTGLQGVTAFSGGFTPNTLNILMNKDIFVHSQFTPSLILPHIGIALISDQQFSMLEQNVANPNMRLGYMMTNGFQVAYGSSVLPKRMQTTQDLTLGIAGKMLWRRGGIYDLGILQALDVAQNKLDGLHDVTGSYGVGYGADLGLQYSRRVGKRLTLSAGAAMTDIGNTAFADPRAMPQASDTTFGIGASYNLKRIKFSWAFDYGHALNDMDFRSHSHTGFEMQFPFITLSGGFNQGDLTYGASFDIWIIRVTAASYGEELATLAGQNTERRYALRIALKVGF